MEFSDGASNKFSSQTDDNLRQEKWKQATLEISSLSTSEENNVSLTCESTDIPLQNKSYLRTKFSTKETVDNS